MGDWFGCSNVAPVNRTPLNGIVSGHDSYSHTCNWTCSIGITPFSWLPQPTGELRATKQNIYAVNWRICVFRLSSKLSVQNGRNLFPQDQEGPTRQRTQNLLQNFLFPKKREHAAWELKSHHVMHLNLLNVDKNNTVARHRNRRLNAFFITQWRNLSPLLYPQWILALATGLMDWINFVMETESQQDEAIFVPKILRKGRDQPVLRWEGTWRLGGLSKLKHCCFTSVLKTLKTAHLQVKTWVTVRDKRNHRVGRWGNLSWKTGRQGKRENSRQTDPTLVGLWVLINNGQPYSPACLTKIFTVEARVFCFAYALLLSVRCHCKCCVKAKAPGG